MGKWVLKKVLVKWSKGLKLNIIRIIVVRKKEYLNTSLDNAFYKNIKKDFKQKLNFKLSNLYRIIFRGKNGIGWDGKPKILPSQIGKRRRFLASCNKGTGREQFSKFNRYINNIISIVEEKKCRKKEDFKIKEQLKQERKDKYKLRTSMLKRALK